MNNNISRVHENLEKIIVDRLFWENEITIFETNK